MSAVMDFPVPKYRKGDKVYRAWHDTARGRYPCPDCGDTRKWVCKSPAGHEMEMDCPRCGRENRNNDLSLDYKKHTFGIRELTIGSVRIDTSGRDEPVSYMAEETGIGSGTIYYESSLYATREEAEADCERQRAAAQAETDATPEALLRLEYAQKPYFQALEKGLRASVRADVLNRLRDEIGEHEVGEHSRGEWCVEEETWSDEPRFSIKARTVDDTYGREVCTVAGSDKYSHMVSAADALANALLIRSAPKMLKALIAVRDAEPEGIAHIEIDSLIEEATRSPTQ